MTIQQDKTRTKKQATPKKRLEALTSELKMAEVIMTPVGDIQPLNHMQKRTRRGDDKDTAKRITQEGQELIAAIADYLKSAADLETTPIWLVSTPEGMKLVDGHHRLGGYQEANRELVPVQRIDCSLEDAHLLADSANNLTQTVKVTKKELLEIAWASLKRLYVDGAWTEGYTNREFARTRNVAAGTVDNMVRRYKELGVDEAKDMAWKEARFKGDIRQIDAEARVEGWISKVSKLQLEEGETEVLAELMYNLADFEMDEEVAKNKAVKALSKLKGVTYNNIEHDEDEERPFVF